jgi:hypothetical protein
VHPQRFARQGQLLLGESLCMRLVLIIWCLPPNCSKPIRQSSRQTIPGNQDSYIYFDSVEHVGFGCVCIHWVVHIYVEQIRLGWSYCCLVHIIRCFVQHSLDVTRHVNSHQNWYGQVLDRTQVKHLWIYSTDFLSQTRRLADGCHNGP